MEPASTGSGNGGPRSAASGGPERRDATATGEGIVSIAAITNEVEVCEPYESSLVRQGVVRAAARLGYHLEVMRVRIGNRRSNSADELLKERGIAALIILPSDHPVAARNYLPWEQYTVVCATDAITSPTFDRAEPDDFYAAHLISEHLSNIRLQKVAYITSKRLPSLRSLQLQAAVASVNSSAKAPLDLLAIPFSHHVTLVRAVEAHQTSAIIVDGDRDADHVRESLGAALAKLIEIVVIDHIGMPNVCGVDRGYEAVGEAAMNHLHTLLQQGKRGIPASPIRISIQGRWIDQIAKKSTAAATWGAWP